MKKEKSKQKGKVGQLPFTLVSETPWEWVEHRDRTKVKIYDITEYYVEFGNHKMPISEESYKSIKYYIEHNNIKE